MATERQLAALAKARAVRSARAAEVRRRADEMAAKKLIKDGEKAVKTSDAPKGTTRKQYLEFIIESCAQRMGGATATQFTQLSKIQMEAMEQLESLDKGKPKDDTKTKTAVSEFERKLNERRAAQQASQASGDSH